MIMMDQIAKNYAGVIYGTTLHSNCSKTLLEAALSTFLKSSENAGELLYTLYYEQEQTSESTGDFSEASIDLAFNDEMLDNVESQWKSIVDQADSASYMHFEDREGVHEYEDENVEDF